MQILTINKSTIIYLVSSWHSGSTLLSMMLGAHSEIESIGEIIAFERRLTGKAAEMHLCSCGKKFIDCDYWANIPSELQNEFGSNLPIVNDPELERFEKVNSALFESILDRSGASIICDSSKDISRLGSLLNCGSIHLVLVYLVRDPRAVGFSMKRKGARTAESSRRKYQFLETVANWRKLHERMVGIQENVPIPYITVRYEDIIRQPERWISHILNLVGLQYESLQLERAGNNTHYIEGNRIRFNNSLNLVADTEYMEAISDQEWVEATSITEPYLSNLGYPLDRT